MSMFQNSVLKSFSKDESKVALGWAEYQKFLTKVDYIKTVKEEKYQDGFLKDIFENCLGYTLDMTNPSNFNLEREKKNETDGKKADGVIYVDNKIVGVIELKAQDTKNLDKIEDQAFNYHNSHSNSKYVIISNFDELRFYINKKTAYEKFSLFNLSYEEFKKLHLLISYESIKDDIPLKIKEKTANFEQNISKELYKDFSIFRNHLFENIVKNNDLDKSILLRLTQKLCDRIIFILFAEDRGLLTANTIREIIQRHSQDGFGDRSMYDYYKLYFDAINEGNEILSIPKYNGGLFSKDEILDSLRIDDSFLDMEAQKLSDYDFDSEVSVNILGHIFEQSLTDLEEIQANIDNTDFDKTKSKRKKDGVFYTPEYITKYIVDNTLGKMCNEKRETLNLSNVTAPSNPKKLTKAELEIKTNLETFKEWLFNLKILDPACGSGAFLNQALEYLIKEHKQLQNDLALMGDLFSSYAVEESVLEHNLYGVDINEDAVEIAKLSLWLRTAQKGRPLTNLADKIKCGNSLISDKSVVENAFVWEEEFKEVFENGGFDIVIGNPPYVFARENMNQNEKNYYINNYNSANYQINTYLLFVEKSINLTKEKGLYGLIIPNAWLMVYSGEGLRKHILDTSKINQIINLEGYSFDNVNVETIILLSKKEKVTKNEFEILLSNGTEFVFSHYKEQDNFTKNEGLEFRVFTDDKSSLLIEKFLKDSIKLDSIVQIKAGLQAYEKGKGNPKQSTEDVKNRPYDYKYRFDENTFKYLEGKDVGRYFVSWSGLYLKYGEHLAAPRTFNLFNDEKIIIREITGKYPNSIIATYSQDLYLYNRSNIAIVKNQDKEISLKYILTVLNSSLMAYYFMKNTAKSVRKMFPKVILQDLRLFPFKEINSIEQEPFIRKANLMLNLNQELIGAKQGFLNELNLDKLTIKLQNFETLEFDEFIKEYVKARKIKFADKLEERKFKNEWKALFENDKEEVLSIQKEINETDKEIDQMVYKLYNLTEDEIKIVEGV
jgi:type I restriction-modification system DNA methylase subunit